jgi:hypothetical protein
MDPEYDAHRFPKASSALQLPGEERKSHEHLAPLDDKAIPNLVEAFKALEDAMKLTPKTSYSPYFKAPDPCD